MLKTLCTILMTATIFFAGTNVYFSKVKETPVKPMTDQDQNDENSESTQNDETYCELANSITQTNLDKRRVLLNELFTVRILVDKSRYTLNDYSYDTIGFEVDPQPSEIDNEIVLTLKTVAGLDKPELKLNIELQEGIFVEPQVFGCVNEYGVFLSPSSYDDAWSYYLEYIESQNIITAKEAEQMKIEYNRQYVQEEIITEENSGALTRASENTWVRGRLEWEDDDGISHPLQFTSVTVYDEDAVFDDVLGEVFTDENGEFICAFENQTIATEQGGCDPYISVTAIGQGYYVSVDGYSFESTTVQNVSTGSTTFFHMLITMDGNLGKAFQILQAAITTARYVTEMDSTGTELGMVRIHYPDNGTGCYYKSNNIYITGSAPAKGMPQSYASWDVIAHEYGHHIQQVFDITDNPGGGHYVDVNMCDHYAGSNHTNCGCAQPDAAQAKYEGIRLAWGESWNTVLGIMSQQYYSGILQNIRTVADSYYTAYNSVVYDLENVPYLEGEGCEATNCGVLYDICDPANELYDTVDMGHKMFFRVTVLSKAKTLSDFVNYCVSIKKIKPIMLGGILGRYKIGPFGFRATSSISKTPPTFSWTAGNGELGSNFQNNRFRVVCFDAFGDEIIKTNELSSTTYTLTQSEWNTVLTSYGSTFTAGVYGCQTTSPRTGEYLSNVVKFTKPVAAPNKEIVTVPSNSRYLEKTTSLLPGQYIDYLITFETDGQKMFQTFGSKDAHLSLYDHDTLVMSDNDSGYEKNALLSYYVFRNTVYKVRMKFFSQNESGDLKLGIIPYEGTEETWLKLDGPYSCSMTKGVTTAGSVSLTTYIVKSVGNYTFFTDRYAVGSDYTDMYLYLIDPTSTNPCYHNDNGAGNQQAKITAELRPNVQYLLIIATFDIQTSGDYCLIFQAV